MRFNLVKERLRTLHKVIPEFGLVLQSVLVLLLPPQVQEVIPEQLLVAP